MDQNWKDLSFDELRTLYREIGAHIAERRVGELERLRAEINVLGFTADDLMPDKPKKKRGRPKKLENGEDMHVV